MLNLVYGPFDKQQKSSLLCARPVLSAVIEFRFMELLGTTVEVILKRALYFICSASCRKYRVQTTKPVPVSLPWPPWFLWISKPPSTPY